ncbi:MAG: hypothetical protein KKH88_02555 [Nanoarchaeota archaeon]|nr:hypothetical protein [Nanoarchaeota archaeon]MBU1445198.1 hypothetical protein [Nanoarchaeota archaeon]MBU2406762.1 hypothetical protein [Nanoarchaeota archaeon]MBU2420282.1 hypothetical protein [Nanoarchaeota archaeon]MBU2475322.1 hypothetical protein [Nanoarchaeota archaeon]
MEKYEELLIEMDRAFKTADHLAYVTYPIVKEIRLLMSIIENLDRALKAGMNAVLEYDRLYKRIGPLQESFEIRLDLFKSKIIMRHAINREYAELIEMMHELVTYKQKSPMVFQRKDKYVISNQKYKLKTLTIEDVKKYVEKAKPFIFKVHNIISR